MERLQRQVSAICADMVTLPDTLDAFLQQYTPLPCSGDTADWYMCVAAVLDPSIHAARHGPLFAQLLRDLRDRRDRRDLRDLRDLRPCCDPARTRQMFELCTGTDPHRQFIDGLLQRETLTIARAQLEYLTDAIIDEFPVNGTHAHSATDLISMFTAHLLTL